MNITDMLKKEEYNCKAEIQKCREEIALLLVDTDAEFRTKQIFNLVDKIIQDEVQLNEVSEQLKILGGASSQQLDDVYIGKGGCGE